MNVSDKFLAEIAVKNLNYSIICDLFELTEEERAHPSTGYWIIEEIKGLQTVWLLRNNIKRKYITNGYKPNPPSNHVENKDTAETGATDITT